MKKTVLILVLLLVSNFGFCIKPNQITLSNAGQIEKLYFNLEQSASVLFPLTAINVTGDLKTTTFQLKLSNSYYWFNSQGEVLTQIVQSDVRFTYNFDNKIEKIKSLNNEVLFKFYYDFEGRLIQVKDGSYNVKFKLHYDFNGELSKVSDSKSNKLIMFYKNFDNQISGIKNENYTYEYKFNYDFEKRLIKIKDANYNQLAKITYENGRVKHINKTDLGCQIVIENTNPYYNQGINTSTIPNINDNQFNSVVTLHSDMNYKGLSKCYTIGNYNSLGLDLNNKISSISLPSNLKMIVYEFQNFGGNSAVVSSNWTASNYGSDWNDKISSFKIMYK